MSKGAFENVEERSRAFLQQRVALFGKVLFGLGLVGLIVRVGLFLVGGATRYLLQPHLLLHAAGVVSMAVLWLSCRGGSRSLSFIRSSETATLLASTAAYALMGRGMNLQVSTRVMSMFEAQAPPVGLVVRFVESTQHYFFLVVIVALTQAFVLRAALVPSSATRTWWLTLASGVPLVTVAAAGHPSPAVAQMLETHAPRNSIAVLTLVTLVWWLFTVISCTVISKIIRGLRSEVTEARSLGQYSLVEKLGEGGMGSVYRARHAMLRRPTAIKLVRPDRVGEETIARFEREVQMTALLTHPNTVTIYDYGRTPDGIFYCAMEFLPGATLEAIVTATGPQPPERVVHILEMVAAALAEAHGAGLVHRDIKPSNIILGEHGGELDVAKVVDFGLVKQLSDDDDKLTDDGAVNGTPMYMAPENITDPEAVDGRADLYAVGAVGYFLLTGEPVFSGKTVVELCNHHVHSKPEPPSKRRGEPLPADLEKLVLDCLEKDPARRPQSADVLRRALSACAPSAAWDRKAARGWWEANRAAVDDTHNPHALDTSAIAIDLRRVQS